MILDLVKNLVLYTSIWKDNFYTPKDNTTQEYREATDKLEGFLPAN